MPDTDAEPIDIDVTAEGALQIVATVDRRCGRALIGGINHQPPDPVDRVDHAQAAPDAVAIDRKEERAWSATKALKQLRGAEERVGRVTNRAGTDEVDTQRLAHL